MRDGVIVSLGVSFCLHLGLVVWGMTKPADQVIITETPPMVVLPIELLSIADETNVAAMTREKPEDADADAREEKTEEAPSAASGGAPPEEAEVEAADVPVPKPSASPSPKATPSPTQRPRNQQMSDADFQKELDAMMKGIPTNKPSQQRNNAPTRIDNVGDRDQKGYGNNKDNTVTYAAYFVSQIREKCWPDMSDAPDADRLRATFRVKFTPNGQLDGKAELIRPARQPNGDRPMLQFIVAADRALKACEPYRIPPDYIRDNRPAIELTFVP